MNIEQRRKRTQRDIVNMIIASIGACSTSLLAQLNEYDFLEVTAEQAKRLDKVYKEFHALVKEITGG